MDPNEALKMARDAAKKWSATPYASDTDEGVVRDLAEAFQDLDQWLSKGGFLPDAWKR